MRGNFFVAQVPVRANQESLFQTRPEFMTSLLTLAQHITGPVRTTSPQPSMTFAIVGPWGAGKSTALAVLRDLVRSQPVSSVGDGAPSDESPAPPDVVGDRATFSTYHAPLYERLGGARATLGFEIVRNLDASAASGIIDALSNAAGHPTDSRVLLPEEQPLGEALHLWSLFGRLAAAPPSLEAWSDTMASLATNSRVHVVFIDDLDRCSTEFTAELLAATSYWSSIDNLFFVVAASWEHVLESAKHLPLGARYPEQAIQKYIHIQLTLPSFITNAHEAAAYAKHLIERTGMSAERVEMLTTLIDGTPKANPRGLLGPLLGCADGTTPREFIHRFNQFIGDIQQSSLRVAPEQVKMLLLRSFWPEFWRRHIRPLELSDATENEQAATALRTLIQATRGILALIADDALLDPLIQHYAEKAGIDLDQGETDAILYLASDPPWVPPKATGLSRGPADETGPTPSDPHSSEDVKTITGSRGVVDAELTEPEDQVFAATLRADTAVARGDIDQARAHLRAVSQIVESQPIARPAAATVGNAALVAERIGDDDLAMALHRGAVRLDPAHFNVLQNYIEYVLTKGHEEYYSELPTLFDTLSTPPGSSHKPARTRTLRLKFDLVSGVDSNSVRDGIARVVDDLLQAPTMASLLETMPLLKEVSDWDRMRTACRAVAEATTNEAERYAALRVLADGLAASNDAPDELQAGRMYLFLIRSGLACAEDLGPPDFGDVLHNCAVVASSLGYADLAGWLWERAYREQPLDANTRRGFARFLDRRSMEEVAESVLIGRPIESTLGFDGTIPPELRAKPTDWWNQLEFVPRDPCTRLQES